MIENHIVTNPNDSFCDLNILGNLIVAINLKSECIYLLKGFPKNDFNHFMDLYMNYHKLKSLIKDGDLYVEDLDLLNLLKYRNKYYKIPRAYQRVILPCELIVY